MSSAPIIAMTANLLVGGLFLRSALEKWRRPRNFLLYLHRFRWPFPAARLKAAGYGVLFAEASLGLAFAFDLGDGVRQPAACAVLAAFTVFLLRERATIRTAGCSCFGDRSRLNRYPVARNLVLIGICVGQLALEVSLGWREILLQAILLGAAAGSWLRFGHARSEAEAEAVSGVPVPERSRPVLLLNYRARDFAEADDLLSRPASSPLFVMLEAPPWFVALKQRKWADHEVVPLDRPTPGEPRNYVLERNKRGRDEMLTEWSSYAKLRIGGGMP